MIVVYKHRPARSGSAPGRQVRLIAEHRQCQSRGTGKCPRV